MHQLADSLICDDLKSVAHKMEAASPLHMKPYMCMRIPEREPERAASRVETWKSRRDSSTWLSRAKGSSDIFANDSDIRMMASSCLHGKEVDAVFKDKIFYEWSF